MGINAHDKQLLLQSIAIIKPNFHCFIVSFHSQLKRHSLAMQCPTSDAMSEKSYILYCMLERVITHLDDLRLVMPFIHHNANSLDKRGITNRDLNTLCEVFVDTLRVHLRKEFNPELEHTWQNTINVFKSITANHLFSTTNIVPLNKKIKKKQIL